MNKDVFELKNNQSGKRFIIDLWSNSISLKKIMNDDKWINKDTFTLEIKDKLFMHLSKLLMDYKTEFDKFTFNNENVYNSLLFYQEVKRYIIDKDFDFYGMLSDNSYIFINDNEFMEDNILIYEIHSNIATKRTIKFNPYVDFINYDFIYMFNKNYLNMIFLYKEYLKNTIKNTRLNYCVKFIEFLDGKKSINLVEDDQK